MKYGDVVVQVQVIQLEELTGADPEMGFYIQLIVRQTT